ncbi:glycosyltransferase involved in cell wall biosynthesis [Pedobacter cryoconitis]|uniref:Glycosyltransferase involved in cell wall biosynthesis n=1 Tax=Pedobacter cryoconitis TaxID=188932 RepID=A0A7W9DLA9_9SPHI|nr:glycosyltransferase family 2 protein [Pedobacter cryoconitis]MBB5621985.1 glycosyltransferase involved in cell wall biosynthesis [Pedobacter cryoconitis]MBB5646767.1 glycosyltransferase involved in cell wall biosynthesis [Pedobacter cryoconitis]
MKHQYNPVWIDQFLYTYEKYEDIDPAVFSAVNKDLDQVQSKEPLVSVVVIAWNEEINILRCVASLSKMVTQIPFEIIVVNNNSKDKTQQTIDQLHVKSFNELTQGAGPARQKGQENALGKYILTADADCFYPEVWIDEMMRVLTQKDVVCVYGRYSFIGEPGFPRWKLRILEKLKDAMAEIRHIKQPYFNTFGISMGYVKEFGLKIGFIKINRRGEDGQLCMDLMRYGKIKQVKSRKARVWTGVRTLSQNGSFYNIVISRIKEDLKRFKYNFITRN